MSTRLEKAETHLEHFDCPCGGEFKADGTMFPSNPPWYGHKCSSCGAEQKLREEYPRQLWVPKGEAP